MPTADSFPLKTQGADGTPTYLLAVVVDDHDMGVTQVRSLIVELVEKHAVFFLLGFPGCVCLDVIENCQFFLQKISQTF